MTNPKIENGLFGFEYYGGFIDRSTDEARIVCHLEYMPAESGDVEFETGLKLSPDYKSFVNLYHAWLYDVDIVELLSQDVINKIEDQALKYIEEKIKRENIKCL